MASVGDLYIGGLDAFASPSLENFRQVKVAGPICLYSLTAHNYNATARMILLIDSATQPVNGAVTPKWAWPIAASTAAGPGVVSAEWAIPPLKFINGMWVCLSTVLTTPFTLTFPVTNDGYFETQSQVP